MQLLFVFVFLFTFTRSSGIENESDLLSSVDIIAFSHSQQVSQHWDCPRISDRAEKAEEAHIWQTVIPDARIEETAAANASRTLRAAKKYKWTKADMLSSNSTTAKSDLLMQSTVLLGMRKPNFDGSAAPLKLLHSMSKQVNQDALSGVLPQLEQSRDKIMDWMARNQAPLPILSRTPNITDPLTNHRLQVPQAVNYHPRVFKDAQFTTGDLVAWMAVASESRRKSHADAFKFFKVMVQSLLPGFGINLGAVPKNSAGEPTKTIYLHRSFQHIPAGADLAFYFAGNRGNFLSLRRDAIMLQRPEGIVDGQQHAALVLFSNANADVSDLRKHQATTEITTRKIVREALEEEVFTLRISPRATDAEAQAVGVSTIRSLAAHLEWDSFLEAQRKLLESKPKLLNELLPEKLVKLVIEYFNDNTYPIIVSAHSWSLQDEPMIAVDSTRLYVITRSEGLKGLNHSLGNTKEDERRLIELGNPQWFDYEPFSSSYDGRCLFLKHSYKTSTNQHEQAKRSAKWLIQGNESEGGRFKDVVFDGEDLYFGVLSRDGQTLCSYSYEMMNPVTRVYRVKEEAGRDPIGLIKFLLNGKALAISGKGNRIIVEKKDGLEIYDIGKNVSKPVWQIDVSFGRTCALNEDGSEATFASDDKLRIVKVDKIDDVNFDQPEIVTVNLPNLVEWIDRLVYDDEGKLHGLSNGEAVLLFDPSAKELVLLEAPQEVICMEVSPSADYIAILQERGEGEIGANYVTTVKRKFRSTDFEKLFGREADKDKAARP